MKTRDLINKLMQHDLDLEVMVQVSIRGNEPADVPIDNVKRENDGSQPSPRVVIQADAEIQPDFQVTYNIARI